MNLNAAIDRYFNEDFHGLAPATIRSHRFYLRAFAPFFTKKQDAQAYSEWVRHAFSKWGERTARTVAMGASARFCAWLERTEQIAKSPHRLVRMPKPEQHELREPFTQEEYQSLRHEAVGSILEWPITLAWETGMAIADCCLIQWSNVNLDKAMLRIRRKKTNELCVIPLDTDGDVLPLLNDWRTFEPDPEWPNALPDTEYVHRELAALYLRQSLAGGADIQKAFAKLRDRAGVPDHKTFHNFRATFCSALANGGMNLAAACKVTGHKDPRVFERYVTGDSEQLREQVLSARTRSMSSGQSSSQAPA